MTPRQPRERAVVAQAMYRDGLSAEEIAPRLGVSIRTAYRDLVGVDRRPRRTRPEERFVRFLRPSAQAFQGTLCIEWGGTLDRSGYGRFQLEHGRPVQAHRFSYEMHVGQIPDGLHIDHLCRNPPCVNPDHLEPVTPAENVRRGLWGGHVARQKAQTHCRHGHPYTPENTYVTPRNCRVCRTCQRKANRRYRQRQRGERT